MTSASGFTWVAREPQLMVGAEGRASSLRSIDYHNSPLFQQCKIEVKSGFLRLASQPGRFFLRPFLILIFRCGRGQFGTIIPERRPKFHAGSANYRSGGFRLCNCRSTRIQGYTKSTSSKGCSLLEQSLHIPLSMKDRNNLQRFGNPLH